MKKLIKFRFFGEVIDLADDHPPEKLFWGDGALCFLAHHHGETSSNRSAVHDDDVDPTLGLSISRNSANSPLWWSRSESDGVDSPAEVADQDRLDYSTLSLSPPAASTISYSSAASLPLVYNPASLRCFCPQSNGVDSPADDVNQNQVDNATLNLSPPDTTVKKSIYSNNKRGRGAAATATAAAGGGDDQKKKKRIRRHDAEASTSASGNDGKKKRRRRNDDEDQRRPLVPIEEIGGLLRVVESRGGSRPEFLYKKKLQPSDVKRSQNRVFLSGDDERVMGFLREEEAAAVLDRDGKGLTVVGVDGGGEVYENLVMTKWESLEIIVIKSDWMKVVDANKAEKDDVMEIWGYRENGKPCLAFRFWREREDLERDGDDHNGTHAASTPTSSNGVMKMKS